QKGGVGKSTLSRALATEASKEKMKVLLADCDPQQATSYNWNKLRGDKKIVTRTSKSTLEIARQADLIIQPTGPSVDDCEPA
ncbi:3051_t:CDS:2, partial [Ambispora gerdemannii]